MSEKIAFHSCLW